MRRTLVLEFLSLRYTAHTVHLVPTLTFLLEWKEDRSATHFPSRWLLSMDGRSSTHCLGPEGLGTDPGSEKGEELWTLLFHGQHPQGPMTAF